MAETKRQEADEWLRWRLWEAWNALPDQVREEGQERIRAHEEPVGVMAYPDAIGVTFVWAGRILLRYVFDELQGEVT